MEAADNVVHAYDLNMEMPDTPLPTDDEKERLLYDARLHNHQSLDPLLDGDGALATTPISTTKRSRGEDSSFHPGPPIKRLAISADDNLRPSSHDAAEIHAIDHAADWQPTASTSAAAPTDSLAAVASGASRRPVTPLVVSVPGPPYRHVDTREFMQKMVSDALRNGHVERKVHTPTYFGETIEVRSRAPAGEVRDKVVHVVVDPAVPEELLIDETNLHFAVHKVIDNAIKFTETGTITISVRVTQTAQATQLLEIRVIDTGCGIRDEAKAEIGKPFFQQDNSRRRAKEGLGLSLFNAKAVVRRLGGDVSLERTATQGPDRGSEFLIRLPMSPQSETSGNAPLVGTPSPALGGAEAYASPRATSTRSSQTANSYPSAEPVSNHHSRRPSPAVTRAAALPRARKRAGFNCNLGKEYPLTIMVVEDNNINRQLLVAHLKKLGYGADSVIQAYDGLNAVQRYNETVSGTSERRVDAILMDLWMPNMDGYEATEKIFEIGSAAGHTPVIMAVTADITNEGLERAKQTGMKGYMTKPFKILDVENLILEHFGRADMY